MTDKELIQKRLNDEGYRADVVWGEDDDGIYASVGRFCVAEDDEDYGMFNGDEGEIQIRVVGAEQYGNRHTIMQFHNDDMDVEITLNSTLGLEYIGP